jgi:hypothetical protein
MIAYDLSCAAAHRFEGWFSSASDYDLQKTNGLLRCPFCDDVDITKQLSAPNIGRKTNQSVAVQAVNSLQQHDASPVQVSSAAVPEAMAAMIEKLTQLQSEVLKDSKWVGRKFAEEVRAIHYGETEPQQIHGESSPQEAKDLAEEGIAICALPLPVIPPAAKN